MAPVPNLYKRQLPSKHQKLAEADALGTVTLWTHFYNCIDLTKSTAFDVHDVTSTAEEDLVAAAYKIYAGDAEKKDVILGEISEHAAQMPHNAILIDCS